MVRCLRDVFEDSRERGGQVVDAGLEDEEERKSDAGRDFLT